MARKKKNASVNTQKNKVDSLSDLGQKIRQAVEDKSQTKKIYNKPTKRKIESINTKQDPITKIEEAEKIISSQRLQKRVFIPEKQEKKIEITKQTITFSSSKKKNPLPIYKNSQETAKLNSHQINPWQSQSRKSDKERDLVIGFDLGTSSAKIIIQDRQLRKAFAIPFDGLSGVENRYLLPTKLFRDSANNLSLCVNSYPIDNLKVNFMAGPKRKNKEYYSEVTNQELLSAYIGIVLIKISQWFWKEKRSEYSDNIINWELNIGIPAKSWDDTELFNAMKETALAGWNLSLNSKSSISIKDIKNAFNDAIEQIEGKVCDENKGQLHPDLVNPVPELVAEVMGFAQSQMRRDGMYLLADVGATTLDISTFILHEDRVEDNIFTILCSDVKKLGVSTLHKVRIKNSLHIFKNKLKNLNQSYDGISALPSINMYQPMITDDDKKEFQNTESGYLNLCSVELTQVVGETKKNKNPLSPAWNSGIPVFLCGGGSQVDLYKKMIPYSGERLKSAGIKGFDIKELPKPANLENDDILPQDYHRLAVSYGLSFSDTNMGKIIPERDVEDMQYKPRVADLAKRYVDKDMV